MGQNSTKRWKEVTTFCCIIDFLYRMFDLLFDLYNWLIILKYDCATYTFKNGCRRIYATTEIIPMYNSLYTIYLLSTQTYCVIKKQIP